MENIKVSHIDILKDNYCWTISNGSELIVVDPGEAEPIINFINESKLSLKAVFITHNHWDHINGLEELLNFNDREKKHVDLHTPESAEVSKVIQIDGFPEISIISTPGHTDHCVSYRMEDYLFCGDAVFIGGCGRVLSGTFEQLFNSIEKIKNLDEHTLLCTGHNYIASNLEFAAHVDSENEDLREFNSSLKENSIIPFTTVKIENSINPFFRANSLNEFKKLRKDKDIWRN